MQALVQSLIEWMTAAAEPWRNAWGESIVLSTGVLFVHLAALVLGAGLALAADRSTLRSWRSGPEERTRQLGELAATHRIIQGALGALFGSGILLFLSDVEEYASSRVFWVKMGLVALLLANGYAMTRTEAALRGAGAQHPLIDRLWRRMRTRSVTSAALWLTTLLAGTILASR